MADEIDEIKHELWDIKTLKLCVGEEEFIEFVIFADDDFCIYEGGRNEEDSKWHYELDREAGKRLRDFLNYALKDK